MGVRHQNLLVLLQIYEVSFKNRQASLSLTVGSAGGELTYFLSVPKTVLVMQISSRKDLKLSLP